MEKLQAFLRDSVEEIRTKVSWPKFSELQNSSTLVLVASLIFALIIGLIDFGFGRAITWFYQSF